MDKPPTREALVDRYKLTMLERPIDLTLIDGDLAITQWGDILAGTVQHAGFSRFIMYWRYNVPAICDLFETTYSAKAAVARKTAELSELADTRVRLSRSNPFDFVGLQNFAAIHREESDSLGALAFSHETYAASVNLTLSSLLNQLKGDVEASDQAWKDCGPHFGGRSLGEIIAAAANAFRHSDEWIRAKVPSKQQRKSMDCLSDALKRPVERFSFLKSINGETLDLLSGGNAETLFANILTFAQSLALTSEADHA